MSNTKNRKNIRINQVVSYPYNGMGGTVYILHALGETFPSAGIVQV